MEVYQVKVFLEVARHLSFTEAADALNLTQPAVSAKIKSLETEIGAPLFYRLGRKIQLTKVGQFLADEGAKLIQVENQLLQRIEELKKGKLGQLKIGCTAALAENWLPEIIFIYRQLHPDIQTQCHLFNSAEELYRSITDHHVDVGISDISFDDFSEIKSTAIDTIRHGVFVSAKHRLAKQDWLSLKELRLHPWVVLPPGSPSRLVLETRLAELNLSLADFPDVETVDTLSLMRTYITQGNYLGFASNLEFTAEQQSGVLTSIALQEFPLSSPIFLVLPKRLSESSQSDLKPKRRSIPRTPTQTFVTLLQDRYANAPQARPTAQLRSPSFVLRTHSAQRPETLTLSIGIQNKTVPAVTAGLIIQRLGLLEHFLPQEGQYSGTQFHIRWRDYPTGAPIISGLQSGEMNIGILGDYPLLLSAIPPNRTDAPKTRLVSFVSANPDGSCSALIVQHQSNLHSIEDLKGKVVAVPFHSSAHGMVMRSFNAADMLNQVKLTMLDHSTHDHSNPVEPFDFSTQPADGYAHFAPFHEIACRKGRFRYLSDRSADTVPAFYGVVVSDTLAEQYPDVVTAYLKALAAAQYWYEHTPSAPTLISQWTRLEAEIVAQILKPSHQNSSHHTRQPGRFFPEMTIRPDWLNLHIAQLSQIPGNEQLTQIDLNQWVQPDFLQSVGTCP